MGTLADELLADLEELGEDEEEEVPVAAQFQNGTNGAGGGPFESTFDEDLVEDDEKMDQEAEEARNKMQIEGALTDLLKGKEDVKSVAKLLQNNTFVDTIRVSSDLRIYIYSLT